MASLFDSNHWFGLVWSLTGLLLTTTTVPPGLTLEGPHWPVKLAWTSQMIVVGASQISQLLYLLA